MKNWLLKRGLIKHKEKALYELRKDIEYIKIFKAELLNLDEKPLRKRLSVLKAKEEPTDAEATELAQTIEKIKISQAVKNEYEKSVQLANDVEDYLSMLYESNN